MIAVVQRTKKSSVSINNQVYSSINQGFMVLLGISEDDELGDALYICNKILNLRIFSDIQGKMNLNLDDVNGEVLLVSQFTLLADTRKGNRPSYIASARPEKAIPLYEYYIQHLSSKLGSRLKTGVFGADMQIDLINDGPVTIIINSKDKTNDTRNSSASGR